MSNFTKITDLEPKGIEYNFKLIELSIDDEVSIDVGVLSIKGKYPRGSEGASIGEYFRGVGVFLREVYDLDALIYDMSCLDYSWGNNLLRLAAPEALQTSESFKGYWLGYRVVGSKKNKDALVSLFCEFGKGNCDIDNIYLSCDEAIESVKDVARTLYKSIV